MAVVFMIITALTVIVIVVLVQRSWSSRNYKNRYIIIVAIKQCIFMHACDMIPSNSMHIQGSN